MKLIKKMQRGAWEYYAVKSVALLEDGEAVVCIGRWDDAGRAETLVQPFHEWFISIHFETWNESSMGEVFPLVASLPEFQGAEVIETIPEPIPPDAWTGASTEIFDVGSAPE